jgi:outer membrane protein
MPRKPPRLAPSLLVAALLATFAVAPARAQQNGIKIAIIDTEQVLLKSETGKKALADLQTLKQQKESQGKDMQQEIKDLQNRVAEGRLSLAEDKLAALQQQLEEKNIAFQRFSDDAQRDLNKRKDEVLAGVDRKVLPIINQIAAEKGYTLIFRKFESGLIYAADDVDITDEVIQRIDVAHAGAAGAAPKPPAAGSNPGSGSGG